MAWYSVLPENLSALEAWIAKFFIVLGLITMGPWAALVVFDFVYYILRVTTYELPIIGGRARGRRKPRAPSLTERPNGRRRAFSWTGEQADSVTERPVSRRNKNR
ncbi:hypothetical protein VTN49DRAFT_5318 [Thermomyces lanuginosus]|uniref:uncharacterized protein n=1 Tax=Thermomyces lanuginosus TaxID=5541 RepID=UPI00374255F7